MQHTEQLSVNMHTAQQQPADGPASSSEGLFQFPVITEQIEQSLRE